MNAEIIQIQDLQFKKFISKDIIQARVKELAQTINHQCKDYEEITILIVLKGAFIFAADLLRHLTIPCRIEMIKASSYGGDIISSGTVNIQLDGVTLHGKHILIIEDIIDTGNTLQSLQELLNNSSIASLKIAALCSKPEQHKYKGNEVFVGFEIPNEFIVGYGLDYNQQGRELPDIWQLYQG